MTTQTDRLRAGRRPIATLAALGFTLFATAPLADSDPGHDPRPGSALEAELGFLVGDWSSNGATLEALGDQAGPYEGRTVCELGGSGTWLACDFETPELGPLGHYAIHTVTWKRRGGGYEAFVVNNYGSATYRGFLEAPGRLVFFGGSRGGEQRITYEALDGGRVRFFVEETRDAARTFQPHTEATWTPRSVER